MACAQVECIARASACMRIAAAAAWTPKNSLQSVRAIFVKVLGDGRRLTAVTRARCGVSVALGLLRGRALRPHGRGEACARFRWEGGRGGRGERCDGCRIGVGGATQILDAGAAARGREGGERERRCCNVTHLHNALVWSSGSK